jgi:PAS domain S-box-containing protein
VIWEGILVDITTLKETEARLNEVIQASRAFTWKLDLDSQRLQFDESWAKVHGYSTDRAAISLSDWYKAVHPDDVPAFTAKLEALRNGAVERQTVAYRRRHNDGHWLWFQVHAGISERDTEGRPSRLSGVSFDITAEMVERARAQEEQAQLREDLQRAQQRETVAQIAGGVAHDLNNLIAVVGGTAEVLLYHAAGQANLMEGLGRIRRAVDMARDLVNGLGGLVRKELPRETHDPGKLMRDAVELLGQRRMARHSVRVAIAEDCPDIWGNPTEFAQVIVNLAINACDAGTQEQPATVRLAVLPTDAALPDRRPDAGEPLPKDVPFSLFTVSDTGLGISDDVRARMFRPHFTTKGKAGTGLGLLIVSTILQDNRAALWVESMPGQGTTITVAWPRQAPGATQAAGQEDTAAPLVSATPPDLLSGLSVMVVDDLADVAEVLADMLEAAGALTVCITDPTEAAQLLAETPNDWSVLVTDLHMPEMDGRALARHANSLSPAVPTVLVTARPDTLTSTSASEFAAILSKPVTAVQLAHAVRKAAR